MSNHEIVLSFALRLYKAIEDNNLDDVQNLIQRKGANPNVILPDNGISCFHLAVGIDSKNFSEEVTRLFLRYGGNPNIKSCEGLTPVHVASIRGRFENLRLLLLAGGNPQTLDDDGCSPMYYAYQEGHLSCFEFLQNYKCIYSKFFMPTLLETNNEIQIIPEITKKCNDLPLESNSHVEIYERSDVSSMDKMNLITYKSFDHNSTWQKGESTADQGKLKDVFLKNISSKPAVEENEGVIPKKKSVDLSINFSEFNPISSSSWVSYQTSRDIFESWLASHSCFTETYEIENHSKRSLRINKVVESEDELGLTLNIGDETKTENESNKDLLKQRINKDVEVEEKNYSEYDETFSKNSDSSASPLSHRTYNIVHSSCDTLLTYEISEISILSSDLSSPVRNVLNTSNENNESLYMSKVRRSYSDSKISYTSNNLRERAKHVTYRRNGWLNIKSGDSTTSSTSRCESDEYFTVPEEVYQYTDDEEGQVLLEKRLPSGPHPGMMVLSNAQNEELTKENFGERSSSTLSSCNTDDLRKEVYRAVSNGCCCPLGPITATTKRVYLRKIFKFKKSMKNNTPQSTPQPTPVTPKFSRELERTLAKPLSMDHSKYVEIEQRMMTQFDGNGKFSQWREGNQKSSFNYLLLDPRLTCNLPLRCSSNFTRHNFFHSDANFSCWRDFLSSIFYIGKGKRSRPYSHLYEAATACRGETPVNKLTKKVKHILEIWKENLGVVCLHVFQNSIPVEAFTREAAMIDAIGINNLKNERRGDYYGVISSLSFSQKREFGAFLLYRAMLIFLNEGERQIRPADID